MLVIDLPHDQLNERVAGLVVLDRQLAAKPRNYFWQRAFDRDKDVVPQVAARDSVHTRICERGENKRKREIGRDCVGSTSYRPVARHFAR